MNFLSKSLSQRIYAKVILTDAIVSIDVADVP